MCEVCVCVRGDGMGVCEGDGVCVMACVCHGVCVLACV